MISPAYAWDGVGDAAAGAAVVGHASHGFDVQQELVDLNFSLIEVLPTGASAAPQLAVAIPRRVRLPGGEQPPGRSNELLYFKVGAPGSTFPGEWKRVQSIRAKHRVVKQGFLTPGAGLRIALAQGGDAVVVSVATDGSSMVLLMSSGEEQGQSFEVGGGIPAFLAAIAPEFLRSLRGNASYAVAPADAASGAASRAWTSVPPPPLTLWFLWGWILPRLSSAPSLSSCYPSLSQQISTNARAGACL